MANSKPLRCSARMLVCHSWQSKNAVLPAARTGCKFKGAVRRQDVMWQVEADVAENCHDTFVHPSAHHSGYPWPYNRWNMSFPLSVQVSRLDEYQLLCVIRFTTQIPLHRTSTAFVAHVEPTSFLGGVHFTHCLTALLLLTLHILFK